jgi:cytochrome c-type biogenesis protein CcsB
MISFRRMLSAAFVAGLVPVASASGYYADTGRTATQAVPQELVQTSGCVDCGPDHNHSHEATSGSVSGDGGASKSTEVSIDLLWNRNLSQAIKASQIDRLGVQSDGVNTSILTWAEIQIHAITGKGYLKTSTGERIPAVDMVLGMIYQNKLWVRAPILPMDSPVLGRLLELPYGKGVRVAPTTIMTNRKAQTLVMAALNEDQTQLAGLTNHEKKLLRQFGSRLATFLNLPGEFRLVPLEHNPNLWLAPIHFQRPELLHDSSLAEKVRAINLQNNPYAAVMTLDGALRDVFETQGSSQGLDQTVASTSAVLFETPGYISARILALDWYKAQVRPYEKSAWIFLLSLVAYLGYLMSTRKGPAQSSQDNAAVPGVVAHKSTAPAKGGKKKSKNKQRLVVANSAKVVSSAMEAGAVGSLALAGGGSLGASGSATPVFFRNSMELADPVLAAEKDTTPGSRVLWGVAFGLLTTGAVFLIGSVIARFILGGRMPVSNMFEAVTFCLGSFALLAVIYEGMTRRGWAGTAGAFFGWTLMMVVNMMPIHQKKVEPLIAVLDSIWLNYHVTSLLVSYAFFLLAFGFSVVQLVKLATGNQAGFLPRAEMFEHLAFRSTQLGWPLLTVGIFLGAVWANTAWGSYWSWDPKETWALITWFVYTIYLHMRMIVGWTDRRAGWVNIAGFVMVLITFFGVSYLPGLAGGMHSYANPISSN